MKEYREFTEQEEKWIRSLQRVMNKAPDTLFMFVGAGIAIFTKDENNKRYMDGGSVDQFGPSEGISTKMDVDGGDY